MNKNLLWKIHNWLGLYTGIVILFLSITGAAALFRPEIDQLLNPNLRQVEPGSEKASLTEAVAKVLPMHPNKYLFEVEMPKAYLDTWIIRLMPKEKSQLNPMIWEVFINPHTGEILGERNYFKSFSYFLRNIHVRFYEAYFGRQIVGLAGIALFLSTITGLFIYGKFMKKQPFGKIRSNKLRITQADLHKFIGISALAFNMMIGITGAWLGLQSYIMYGLDISQPNNFSRNEKVFTEKEDMNYILDFDAIYQKSQLEFPNMIPWFIRPTTNGEGIVQVLGNVPGQAYERRSNKLVFDKQKQELLFKYNISDQNFGAKLYFVQESFHFGDFAGISLKILYCLLALSSGFLSLSGFIIYLERTRKSKSRLGKTIPLKSKLSRWTIGILGTIAGIAIMSIKLGLGIPSLLVAIAFYGFLIAIIIKKLLLKTKRSTFKNLEV
ncbi:PepSY-associated TM helix domain-containing protein [Cyclobacterium sp. 1_MG-2023]|uniref:PepSY-associated TM helix domain-containing protein n=1 Tax=Cyclobacterium sp. 1_MG-2023 TaxID=3062681 RepID=UPI0026E3B214|nr:PepSY-associated TM helix domain-containing protein [Cyclobacterium sp. 1_MG-2023]MDO6435952.1 PepSY-associated TM helix domain-containing protein [Cyclobacterium sp. 1_MG-2023]